MNFNDAENKWLRGLLGLGLLLLIIGLVNRTRLGHVIVYDALVLTILVLFLTQSRLIGEAIANAPNAWKV